MNPSIRALALTVPLLGIANAQIRIVACDAQVQSHKRGVCANHLEPADFTALAPGVSWWYDWDYRPSSDMPVGTKMEFLPMAWGNAPQSYNGLAAYLRSGAKPRAILALNEPNLKGQAYITPEQAAQSYSKIKALADQYKAPVVGPHMALGSKPEDSITAYDPIDKKQTTYTFMVPFLKAFLAYAGKTEVSATSLHSYGNAGEMRWAVDLMHKEFNRPVWVTEYMHVPNPAEGLAYLMQTTDYLERTPYVEGYSWFKERAAGADEAFCLLAPEAGKLSALGEAYVQMPVHDADLYYRIPGRLQAERYVRMENAEIQPTSDKDGLADMIATGPGATLSYNVQIDQAGSYDLAIRVSGEPGSVSLGQAGRDLGSATSAGGTWAVVRITAKLAKGPQTIELKLGAKGMLVNWIAFSSAATGHA